MGWDGQYFGLLFPHNDSCSLSPCSRNCHALRAFTQYPLEHLRLFCLSVCQPGFLQETGGKLKQGNLRRVGKCRENHRDSARLLGYQKWSWYHPWVSRTWHRVCVTRCWRDCCVERLASVTAGRATARPHFLLPAHIPLCPPLAKPRSRPEGGEPFGAYPSASWVREQGREGQRVTRERQMEDGWDI